MTPDEEREYLTYIGRYISRETNSKTMFVFDTMICSFLWSNWSRKDIKNTYGNICLVRRMAKIPVEVRDECFRRPEAVPPEDFRRLMNNMKSNEVDPGIIEKYKFSDSKRGHRVADPYVVALASAMIRRGQPTEVASNDTNPKRPEPSVEGMCNRERIKILTWKQMSIEFPKRI